MLTCLEFAHLIVFYINSFNNLQFPNLFSSKIESFKATEFLVRFCFVLYYIAGA